MRRSSYKNKVLFCAGVLLAFVVVNFAVWHTCTKDLITNVRYDGGDLSRIGYIPEAKMYRHSRVTLPRRHVSLKDYTGEPVDLVTIGDSFSNGGGGGENPYYQDYIASYNNMSVLNLEHYRDLDFITTVSLLLKNGFLERARPRILMIGATERGMMDMAHEADFSRSMPLKELLGSTRYPHGPPPPLPFINSGNFKFLVNRVAYRYADHGVFGNVQVGTLDRDFFSVPMSDRLLYLPYPPKFSSDDVAALNDNLNHLSDLLAAKGIRLVYMPYVDKYTLYCKWLRRKKYPESPFFEMLRPLPKRYRFIDTKQILRAELERGEKDVFYADDTHASWKASQRIFTLERFDSSPALPGGDLPLPGQGRAATVP